MYMQVGAPAPAVSNDIIYDIPAIERGFVSITPITSDRTNFTALSALGS